MFGHKGEAVEMMLKQIFKLELLEKPADCVPPVEAPLGSVLVSVSWGSLGQSEGVWWLLLITGIVHDFIWRRPWELLQVVTMGSRCSREARSLGNGRLCCGPLVVVVVVYWVRCLGVL